MQAIHIPRIEPRYWTAILLASIFGTNTGDLFAHESGLGILGGLPVLGLVLAVAWWLERRDPAKHEAWYWLAIIAIRTGATNIADFLCGRRHLGLDRVGVSIGLALLIAALVWRKSASRGPDLPRTDAGYWLAMLAAGVLGTAGGDAVLGALGGPGGPGGVLASLLLLALFGAALAVRRAGWLAAMAAYWLAICLGRTAGTAIADSLAENTSLGLGLPLSTLGSGLAFVAVLVLWKPSPVDDRVAALG